MSNLDEIFVQMQATKKKQRDLRKIYQDALSNSPEYHNIKEEIKKLNISKRKIESQIKNNLESELTKIENMQKSLKEDDESLGSMVLVRMMKGEVVKLKDLNNTFYEPVIKIKFRRADAQE